jgi:hypothetical protein
MIIPNWVKHCRDQNKARSLRNIYRKRNYSKTQGYQAREWTVKEMDLVLGSDKSDRELSTILNRSIQSIQIKRCRLKKKDEVPA